MITTLKDRVTLMANLDGGKDSRGNQIVIVTVIGPLPAHVGYLSTKMGQTSGWPVTQLTVTIPYVAYKAANNKVSGLGNWLRWDGKDLLSVGDALVRSLGGRRHHLVVPVKLA